MEQISKSKNNKPKEGADYQYNNLELFICLISACGDYPFPKRDISERLIVIPFTSCYTGDQPEP